MGASLFEFACKVGIIFQVILRARRIQDIARVADGCFTQLVFFGYGIHRDAHVLNPVEAVEHTEQVYATLAA